MTNVYCGEFWRVYDDGKERRYVKAESLEEGTALLEAMEAEPFRLTIVEEVEPSYTFEISGTVNGKEVIDRIGVRAALDKKAIQSAIRMFKSTNGGMKRGKRRTEVEVKSYTFTKKTAVEYLPAHYFDQ
jgi:uncharacterized protein (UPF0216 family)